MNPISSRLIASSHLQKVMRQLGAQFMPGRSNGVRHIYFVRRTQRWLSVSNEGRGMLRLNEYAECPCGATT